MAAAGARRPLYPAGVVTTGAADPCGRGGHGTWRVAVFAAANAATAAAPSLAALLSARRRRGRVRRGVHGGWRGSRSAVGGT
ncbi:MAG TPA: hypothetical protein VHJ18_12880 [Streptosporangiaceae bacterium]|nr:hypothetical protein [Streptosporangiaceae bacterium]